MALTRGFIRNAPTTPLDARLMDMAKVYADKLGNPRAGVLGHLDSLTGATALVTTQATMHLAVAAAEFVVTKGKADGVTILTNDGTVLVPITAAPVSNSRIDVLWVKHNDNTTGDADSLPVFGVTAGAAAASPTKPAIPTGALELATLRVYSGTTATNGGSNSLTMTYQWTTLRGGRLRVNTVADRDALTNVPMGQVVDVIDRPGPEVWGSYTWDGNGWKWCGKSYFLASGSGARAMGDTNLTPMTLSQTARIGAGWIFTSSGTQASIQVPEAGVYRVAASILFPSNSTGRRELFVQINGATDLRLYNASNNIGAFQLPVAISADVLLAANDNLILYGRQNSGSTLDAAQRFLVVERVA
jgi:hypothetical protein